MSQAFATFVLRTSQILGGEATAFSETIGADTLEGRGWDLSGNNAPFLEAPLLS